MAQGPEQRSAAGRLRDETFSGEGEIGSPPKMRRIQSDQGRLQASIRQSDEIADLALPSGSFQSGSGVSPNLARITGGSKSAVSVSPVIAIATAPTLPVA